MGFKYWKYARRVDADTMDLYTPDNAKALRIDTSTANRTDIMGQDTTGDIIKILSNSVDSYPYIQLDGAGLSKLYLTSGWALNIYNGTILIGQVLVDPSTASGVQIHSGTNGNIYLAPDGTGYVKFGTRTATGDVACNGHIDIKDSSDNVVKLMTTA